VARALPTLLVIALLGASAAAFAFTEGKKLEKTPITGTGLSAKVFSPVCGCAKDHVTIRFRLRKPERLTVWMRRGDEKVDTLVEDKAYRRGWVRLTWNGIQENGIAVDDGAYNPVVHLVGEHRTIVLPNPIRVDTVAPKVLGVQPRPLLLSPDGDGRGDVLTVRYRTDESAHGVLFVDRKQVVYARFVGAPLRFFGKVGGKPLAAGPHPLTFAAEDAAGNRSKPQRIGTLTIRYVTLARSLVSVGPGERFYIRVSADAKRVSYRFGGRSGTARPGTLVLRAPKKVGTYRLYVSVGSHADVARVKVERIG
jgi:hypothetical protein